MTVYTGRWWWAQKARWVRYTSFEVGPIAPEEELGTCIACAAPARRVTRCCDTCCRRFSDWAWSQVYAARIDGQPLEPAKVAAPVAYDCGALDALLRDPKFIELAKRVLQR